MRVVTWNINSIRLRLDLVKKIKEELSANVLLLQETKVSDENFPTEELMEYFPYMCFDGEKSYNGVATLSDKPITNVFSLKAYNESKRHIACEIEGVEIHNFYLPAGGDDPNPETNPKFFHKLEYLKFLEKWFIENRKITDKMLLAGDLNIAPYEHDVWSSRQLRFVVSHTDIEREMLLNAMNNFGWIDIAREFVDLSEKLYSWWSYRNRDWKKSNRGRRLDHIWVTPALKASCKNFDIIREARDWPKPSDHVPVIIDI